VESEEHEITVWARSGKHQTAKEIRLIARRKTPQAIEKAHKDLRRQASRRQPAIDPRSYVAAEFLVLATSSPAEDFPAGTVPAAYRLHRQIELAFKRLKTLIKIDKIRSRSEAGTRCWLYANLIVALLAEDCSQDFLESFPQDLADAGAMSSLWRVTALVLHAILAAIGPAITLSRLLQPAPALHKRIANPKRKRNQAVNYHKRHLS